MGLEQREFEGYQSRFQKIKDTNRQGEEQEVILFFSFDVVNSSLYKTINYYGWAQVLTSLFKELHRRVNEGIEESELWRILGDEAIFIVRIKSEDDIYNYVKIIFNILVDTITDLKSGKFFDTIKLKCTDQELKLMKLQNILSLKAAAWIAVVSKLNSEINKAENIVEEYEIENKTKFYEFLGNDIDAGFRISAYTADSRLVVSFELAVLLAKRTESLKKLNIITYKQLKGIWKNRYYPIIWYHDQKKFNNLELKDTFEYDSGAQNELIKEYIYIRDNRTDLKYVHDITMYTDVIRALNKILDDIRLRPKIEQIDQSIRNADRKRKDYLKPQTLELHCVAVCYNVENKQILVAKRADNRETESGKWEFGCAKASKENTLKESIINDYKEDFGIDIKPICDGSRKDSEPIPIAVYQIEKRNGLHKGIIVLAETIINSTNVVQSVKGKHSEIKWISESDIESFKEEECVSDFKNTLKSAFKKIKELEEEKENE